MNSWVCTVCGYVYDPKAGDTKAGIQPGTAFEALPDDWVCPTCGVGKDSFEVEKEEKAKTPAPAAARQEIQRGVTPAIFNISYGLFVVTSVNGAKINGQCANTVFQITSEPPTIAVGINKANYTHEFIQASGVVGISILGQQGHELVRRFGYSSGRDKNKFEGASYTTGSLGAPLLTEAIAHLEGKVVNKLDCGTHTLFLVEVLDGAQLQALEPMTYAYFRATK
ncbi:MAG: flavin reductase [Peptococcaceae bacterium]|jgi:flavin reductase (DIM6/NTAB) family NADH-FMN oxidoreductase RutF/rubredoxin|nr:flavin reductase [Peptococcaceae bacterium]